MKSKVASFSVDHTTLDRGFYLRSTYKALGFYPLRSYDMRFRAPREKSYLTPEAIHTIEHLMAHYLRQKLGTVDYLEETAVRELRDIFNKYE